MSSPNPAAIGQAHRAWLRQWIVPRLYVGCRVPTAKFVAKYLRIDESRAGKQLRRVLAEDGVVTKIQRIDTGCRLIVVALPERREAA